MLTEEIRSKLDAPRYRGLLDEASDLHAEITDTQRGGGETLGGTGCSS